MVRAAPAAPASRTDAHPEAEPAPGLAMQATHVPGTARVAQALSVGTMLIGLATLLGWALDIPILRGAVPGRYGMVPNTAVALLSAALALWAIAGGRIHGRPMRHLATPAALVVAALGLVTLGSHLFGWDSGLDRLLFPERVSRPGEAVPHGRMAPNSALSLTLLGSALVVLGLVPDGRRLRRWEAALVTTTAGLTLTIALSAIVGYLYAAERLYALPGFSRIAANSAVALTLLSLGTLLARPGQGLARVVGGDDAGAFIARRLLPVAVVVPVVLGALRISSDRARLFSPEFSSLLRTVAEVLILLAVVLVTARRLRALDQQRRGALAAEREARTAAEAANRTKADFLASMSHELRTPLNAIAGYVQLIEMGLHGPVTPQQREVLGRVERAERRLLSLVNDVLNFAKLEAGRVAFDIRDVLVADVIREVVPFVEPQLRAKGLEFTVSLPEHAERGGGAIHVWADAEKLGQVLLNLLSNAVKFTPSRRPDGSPGRVTFALVPHPEAPDLAEVRVCDTGVGIPADRLAAVFEPFVQVSTGLTRPHEGTGLGLAISRDLARGMGGDLTVESVEGTGSVFILVLPRAG